tara:strand:+ start:4437 stop:4565 length:129 start_codon:yes stop_codon:yes gene_type:complete
MKNGKLKTALFTTALTALGVAGGLWLWSMVERRAASEDVEQI